MTYMQRRILDVHDAKIRRCWFCGCQNWAQNDCTACTAPADRIALTERIS